MRIHNPTAIEIRLEKMNNAILGAGGDIHQGLLVLDLGVSAVLAVLEPPRAVELIVQLLDALGAEGVQFGVVFELGDQVVLVRLVVFGRAVDDRGDFCVKLGYCGFFSFFYLLGSFMRCEGSKLRVLWDPGIDTFLD